MSQLNFASSIMLHSSGWAYYRWGATTLFVAIYTWWFFLMEQVSSNQSAIQLSFALMFGALAACLVWLVDLVSRRVYVDDVGIKTSFIFQPQKRFYWDELVQLTWWQSGKKMFNYRLSFIDGQLELALDTVTWKQVPEAVRLIINRSGIVPQNAARSASKQWLRNAVSASLVVLGFSLSTLIESDVLHAIGFLLVRVFWTRYLVGRPSFNIKTIRGNMLVFTVATLIGLVFIAGSNLLNLASWWLYTPLIDMILTYLIQKARPFFA